MAANRAMDQYADGDSEAFSTLYDILAPRLFAFLHRQTRDRAGTEDLVQQTLLKLHCARSSFARGGEVFPWAFAIARRLVIDAYRRGKYAEVLLDNETPTDERVSGDAPADELIESMQTARVVERAGEACVTIDAPGVNPWDVQIVHKALTLRRAQRYVIDFRAWSSVATAIRLTAGKEVPPYNEYWANRFAVGTAPRRFRAEFVMGDPDDEQGQLAFHVGGGYVKQTPVTVCVDDVYLLAPKPAP